MSRINNIFDLHKERKILISEDYTKILLVYEGLKFRIFSKKDWQMERKFVVSCIPGNLSVNYLDDDTLEVEFVAEQPSLENLWLIALVLAYFLGEGIIVYYYYKNFPYYHIPKALNLGGGQRAFFVMSEFMRHPEISVEAAISLLNDRASLFGKLLAPMLYINNVEYYDIRFFGEFVLLENISKNHYASSLIVDGGEKEKPIQELEKILLTARNSITDSNLFTEEQRSNLLRKLQVEIINVKGLTKEKLFSFIDGLGKEFSEYKDHVRDWNKLRNKGLAHGATLSSYAIDNERDRYLMDNMHNLLCHLLYRDFHDKVSTIILEKSEGKGQETSVNK